MSFWEEKFQDRKKDSRKERKQASFSDRSRFKVTDKAKEKKEKELPSHLITGQVTLIRSQGMHVASTEGEFFCTLKGALKLEQERMKNLGIVGDQVLFEKISPKEGVIHKVLPRHSVLCREDSLHRIKCHLVAANVDQVLITVSVVSPLLRMSVIDRFLIAAFKGNMKAVIVINKIDLLDGHPEEKALYEECCRVYNSLNIKTIGVSAKTQEGIEELKCVMKDKTSVFSGQSGVGKTHLINLITGLSLKVSDVVSLTKKGSHTTTFAQLIKLSFGGVIVDTPGIRSFGIWDFKKEDLFLGFPEMEHARRACSFRDCWHQGEEGCSIDEALKNHEVSPLRLASYRSLLQSFEEEHRLR